MPAEDNMTNEYGGQSGKAQNAEGRLEDLVKDLKEARMPANRIYDAIVMQVEKFQQEFSIYKDLPLGKEELKSFSERFATVSKLGEIYLKGKENTSGMSPEEKKQVEMVQRSKEVLRGQIIDAQKMSVTSELEDKAAKMQEYSEALRTSSVTAMVSLRDMEDICKQKEQELEKNPSGRVTFDDREKAVIKEGMASVMLYAKIMNAENGQNFYETFIKPQHDYQKAVKSVAASPEFGKAAENSMNPKGLRQFLSEKSSPAKLWNGFESNLRLGTRLPQTPGRTNAPAAVNKPAPEAGKKPTM